MSDQKVDLSPTEEAKEKIIEVIESKKEYTYEELLELFDGGSHMEPEQIKYIYHFLRGDIEESKHYLSLCLKNAEEMNKKMSKMVNAEETNFNKY